MLEGANEGFGPGVVVGIGASGHALAQAGGGESLSEGALAYLAAAIAVENGGGVCGASLESLAQGGEDEIRAEVVGQVPADDAAGAQIDDDRQVEPAVLVGMK
ncbi:MAG: hypothetical protein WDN28_25425 [Chthoniobacter sp.]